MDDDWGLNAVVRGCTASLSEKEAAEPSLSGVTTTAYVADFDFQSFNTNNNNTPFLFAPSSSSSSSSPSFGKTQNSQTSGGGGVAQLFSLSSDPIATRPRRNSNIRNTNNNRVVVEDLHELYKPFFIPATKPEANNSSSQISSFTTILSDQMRPLHPLKQLHNNITPSPKNSHAGSVSSSTTPRSKKRKNQIKKVCQVPAESLSSDIWAWRKYGQKPIKGSPYPRGYYRCSSSKGCLARKQVERNRSDPAMFIVTYTSEHNHPAPTHRNSLAGSTRQKPSLDPSKPLEDSSVKPSLSPATSSPEDDLAAALSGSATESKDGPESSTMVMEDEEEDEFGVSDIAVSDDFFVGLEGLGSPVTGDFSSDGLPASFGLPWSAGSAAAAAGGR